MTEERDREREFDTLCDTLTRNDPSFTHLGFESLRCGAVGRGPRLGAAMRRNTHVSHLTLPARIICHQSGGDRSTNFDPRNIEGLVSYVRHSKAMRALKVVAPYFCDRREAYHPELWMDAVANNEHIQEFGLETNCEFALRTDALIQLFQTTKSLTHLHVPARYDDNGDPKVYANAIKGIQTLETLKLDNLQLFLKDKTKSLIRGLIPSTRSTRNRLVSVDLTFEPNERVSGVMPVMNAVVAFIKRASPALTSFAISHPFDKKTILCFLKALVNNNSLTNLAFNDCYFSDDAIETLVTYMQEQNGVGSNGGITCLGVHRFDNTELPLDRLIQGPRASGLTSLEVTCKESGQAWANLETCFLADQSPQLTRLKVQLLDTNGECDALIRHLPSFVHLRTLEVWYRDGDPERQSLKALLDALRKNASLYTIIVRRSEIDSSQGPILSETEARLVEAFGQRNRHLPELLRNVCKGASTTTALDEDQVVPNAAANTSNERNVSAGADETTATATTAPRTLLSMAPGISRAQAQLTPEMTTHHMFKSVFNMKDSIGAIRHSTIRQRDPSS